MKKWLLLIGICFNLVQNQAVFAIKVTNLYQTNIPVSSQSQDERDQYVEQALIDVLMKVSGSQKVSEFSSTLKRTAKNLLQEYRYISTSDPHTPYLLQMTFDSKGVNRLLKAKGMPIWSQNRPLILVWLAYQAPNQAFEVIGEDSLINIPGLLKQNGDRRGLSFIFPMMDMAEMTTVLPESIINLSLPSLEPASKRYHSEALLVGQVRPDQTGFQSHWTLILGQDQWSWDISQKTVPEILSTLVDYAANTLSSKYAVAANTVTYEKLVVKITGISQAGDFGLLMNYLKNLVPVAEVVPLRLMSDEVVLNIKVSGNQQAFAQAVSLNQHLLLQPNDPDNNILVYQWIR